MISGFGMIIRRLHSHWNALRRSLSAACGRRGHQTLLESNQAEEMLQQLAFLVESSSDAIIGQTVDRVIVSWNKAAERLFGYTAAEMKGRSARILLPDDSPDEEPALLAKILLGESVQHFETERLCKDGRRVAVSLGMSPIKDADNHVIGASVIACDITERKHMEQALGLSEEKYRAVIETARDAIISANEDGNIVAWNNAAEAMFGYSLGEIMGKPLVWLFPARFKESPQPGLGRFDARGYARILGRTMELVGARKDKTEFPIEIAFSPWSTKAGHFFAAIIRDITERKSGEEELKQANIQLAERQRALQEALRNLRRAHKELQDTQLQLIHAAKMESVGRLAAGVAHEVKNPLATLLMGVDVLADHFPPDDADIAALLRDMNRAIRRADTVIKGLLDFSAPHKLNKTPESLNAVIDQALVLSKHELDRCHVSVLKDFQENLPPLPIDRVKIEQVMLNLIMNAVQAMPDGGTIAIRTTVIPVEDLEIGNTGRRQEKWEPSGSSAIIVTVDDTGSGISADKLHKVFDPFFTTKPTGQGTGLGLTVSKSIIELHGGTMTIGNRPERGARATLIFDHTQGATHEQQTHFAHR